MPPPKLEYADFRLIDPTRLNDGVEAATVMVIGALIRGSSMELEGSPAQMASAVNHNIAELSHTKVGIQRLKSRAQEPGHWQLYFCSLCGARLRPKRCAGCGRKYKVEADTFTFVGRQPTMPRKISAYARANGHRFEGQR